MYPRSRAGFTLVELMVVVGIVAILGAVAAPMYGGYVKRARADEGQAALALIKAKQELFRATRFTYAANLSDLPGFDSDEANHGKYFKLEIVGATRNSFVVRAWDGQEAISHTAGGEEWMMSNNLDTPCRTKSSLHGADDPCLETIKAALAEY